MILAPIGQGLLTLPAEDPDHCHVTRHLTGKLNPNGDLTVEADEVLLGARAVGVHGEQLRQGDVKFGQRMEARFHTTLPFLSDLTWAGDWSSADIRTHLTYKFKAARAMRTIGTTTLLVCPRLVAGDFPYEQWKTDWEGGVWLAALGIEDEVRLLLPDGFTVTDLPADLHQELPFATASLSYRIDGRTLVYVRQYARKAGLLGKGDYDAIWPLQPKTRRS